MPSTGTTTTQDTLQEMHRVGQGVWELHTYSLDWFVHAIMQPFAPADPGERLAVRALMPLVEQIMTGEAAGIRCLLCDSTFDAAHLPARFLTPRPSYDAIDAAGGDIPGFANLLCLKCAALPDWSTRVLEFYRKNLITDLRPITLIGSGHA